jgi:hypothetical protein
VFLFQSEDISPQWLFKKVNGSFQGSEELNIQNQGYGYASLLKYYHGALIAESDAGYHFASINASPISGAHFGITSQGGAADIFHAYLGSNNFKVKSTGALEVATSAQDALSIVGSSSSRATINLQATNSASQATFYFQNNRGSFASYGGLLYGGTTNAIGNLFGLSRPDRMFVFADGASNLGLAVGTLSNQSLTLGTNNTARITVKGSGVINIASLSSYADNAAALAGGLVSGDVYKTATGQLMIVY